VNEWQKATRRIKSDSLSETYQETTKEISEYRLPIATMRKKLSQLWIMQIIFFFSRLSVEWRVDWRQIKCGVRWPLWGYNLLADERERDK
jgi:hypothetical protein